ncbi:MAG: ankyrin repeat domain-containing protein [Rubrivivax sp.]
MAHTKDAAKPESKKTFSKADVKSLYQAIERGNRETALALAFAAPGSFKVHKPGGAFRDGYAREYWPMELAIRKKDVELLEAFRPYVVERADFVDSWLGKAWTSHNAEIAELFVSWLPDFRDADGEWLRRAAACGSVRLVDLALPVSDPLTKRESGETALMLAARSMAAKAVERLLPLSDAHAVDEMGRDALMNALDGLLSRSSSTPLHGAPAADELACFRSLVQACGVHRRDADGMSAMSRLATKSEDRYSGSSWRTLPARYAELLVAAGAADVSGQRGEGLLLKAIEAGDEGLFERLLPSSDLNQADDSGLTPLLMAARLGRSGMVATLAPLSDCNRHAADGSTALMLSTQFGDLASARLLSAMTDRSLRDAQGRTALMIAAENLAANDSGKSELLIFIRLFDPASTKGQGILPWLVGIPELFEAAMPFCDPDEKATSGKTALHRAIALGDLGAFEALMPISDIKLADGDGATPLMLAIEGSEMSMFRALLPGSDALAIDGKGKTALMRAVDRGDRDVVKALLPVSDVKAADHEGLTALMIAATSDDVDIAASLMPTSDADAIDQAGKTALIHAMENWRRNEEMILFLAERTDLSKIGEAGRAAMNDAMAARLFPQEAAEKLRGMMSGRSERDELLRVMAEPKKPSRERKTDAFYAAPKAKPTDAGASASKRPARRASAS